MVILPEGRSVANLSSKCACSVAIDVLLDKSIEGSLFFCLDVDAGDKVGVVDCFYSFLNDELVLLML